jgi:predicted nucleotidyltransferase
MGKSYSISEIKEAAVPIAVEYGVNKLALFGSYARGEQTEASDIDFVIDKGDIVGLIKMCEFNSALEDKFGVHVDVLTYNALRGSLIEDALSDEVVLYERH